MSESFEPRLKRWLLQYLWISISKQVPDIPETHGRKVLEWRKLHTKNHLIQWRICKVWKMGGPLFHSFHFAGRATKNQQKSYATKNVHDTDAAPEVQAIQYLLCEVRGRSATGHYSSSEGQIRDCVVRKCLFRECLPPKLEFRRAFENLPKAD